VERIFAYGEHTVRSFVTGIPDGRYSGSSVIDGDGISDNTVPIHVTVEIRGSDITVDLTDAPPQQVGPINSPLPGTVSAARVALSGLVGGAEGPDQGQFRPLVVKTQAGSIFHPVSPAPCFNFWIAQVQLIEAFYRALAAAAPEAVGAESGGDILATVWWGSRRMPYQTRAHDAAEPWIDGAPASIGQGAHARGDGSSALMHFAEACTRFSPVEVWQAKNPWLIEKMELAPDSCGPGRFRGGLGVDLHVRALAAASMTTVMERTKTPPRGLFGGGEARPNSARLRKADGTVIELGKHTAVAVEAGDLYELHTGGGGGYGEPEERDPHAVAEDLAEGLITLTHARRWYPNAFDSRESPRDDERVERA
jgi:N-methylhydantoinase B